MTPRRKPKAQRVQAPRKRASKRARIPDPRGLYVLRLGDRVVLDVIVPGDGELLAFLRVDGELLAEVPVLGQA